jgi:hypothetical protein
MLSIPLPPIDLVIPIRYATCAFVSPARFGVGNALGVSTSQPHQEDQPMYVIIAPIQIQEGHKDAFIEAMVKDARNSVNYEPEYLRFDVIQDANDPNRIWLYEVYQDEAAFQAHL